MNMSRKIFFAAVAAAVVSVGNVQCVDSKLEVRKNLNNPAITVPVLLLVRTTTDQSQENKEALDTMAFAALMGKQPVEIMMDGAINRSLTALGNTSYGQSLADTVAVPKEYSSAAEGVTSSTRKVLSIYAGGILYALVDPYLPDAVKVPGK